jgi:glutamate racemase
VTITKEHVDMFVLACNLWTALCITFVLILRLRG